MLLCCLFGMTAKAQDATPTLKLGEESIELLATIESQVQVQAQTAYTGDAIGFSVEEVTSELGINKITDAALYIVNDDGTCVENTTDGWRDLGGNAAYWGTSEGMVCVKITDPASGVVDYIGTIDESYLNLQTYLARWAFVYDKKAVVLNVRIGFTNAFSTTEVLVGNAQVPIVEQQTVKVDIFEKTAYSGDQATFDAAALATALGVEKLSDAKAYILNITLNDCVENTTDGWRNGFGEAAGWGTSPSAMCIKISDPDSGLIDYIGAIDKTHVQSDVTRYKAAWAFVANDKAAVVNVEIRFVVDPVSLIQIPEQQTDVTQVSVLKTAEVSSERYATNGYETSPVELTISDLAATLGIENKEDLASIFNQIVYVVGEDDIQCMSNKLQLLTLTDGWLSQAVTNIDGEAGDPLDEVIGAGYGGNSKFFIHEMAYDAQTDKVSFLVGQYPGNLKTGEAWPVNLYILWGDKAYVIRYTMNIAEPPSVGFDGLEQVGETIELSYEQYPTSDFSALSVQLDTEAAAEAMGCEVGELSLKALINENGFSTAPTANNGGWWFTQEGFVTSYGSNSAFFIEPAAAGEYAALNMGQMPGVLKDGDAVSTDLYLVGGEKFVKYHITLNVVAKEVSEDWEDWQVVASRTLVIDQVANDGYAWSERAASISNSELETLIGTTQPTLYALANPATIEEGSFPYTDNYTMGEKPGFWLTPEGYCTDWNVNAPWGITSQAATTGVTDGWGFKCIQMPGSAVAGTHYSGKFYLVNEENSKMIEVLIVNNIVEELSESDIVGTDEINVAVSGDDFVAPYDLNTIAQAIGFADADEMSEERVVFGMTASGIASEPIGPSTWLNLDIEGNVVPDGEGQIFIFFENGTINVTSNDFQPAEDWMRSIEIYFEHPTDGKRYVLKVNLMSQSGYTAIGKVGAGEKTGSIYDLSGRKVSKAVKGIFITNNKLVVK